MKQIGTEGKSTLGKGFHDLLIVLFSLLDFILYRIIATNAAMAQFEASNHSVSEFIRCIISGLSFLDLAVFLIALLSRTYTYQKKIEHHRFDLVLSFVFSVSVILGNSYDRLDSSQLVTGSASMCLTGAFTAVMIVIYSMQVILLIRGVLRFINSWNPKLPGIWEKHPFLFPFFIIFFCWVPYVMIRYPAAFEWDAYHQLMGYMGDYKLSQHWPIASTYFFGILYKIGTALFHSNNRGIFFVVIVQTILCDACLAYSVNVMGRLKASKGWQIVSTLGYAVLTIYPRYLTALVKDALYSCFVLFFVCELAIVLFEQENNDSHVHVLMLFISGLLTCLFRNNGKHIVLFCLICSLAAVIRKKKQGRIVAALTAVLLLQWGYTTCLDANGFAKGSIREALSIPFQQTARYTKYYSDQVTEEEKTAIDRVLNYDIIAEKYNPKISDYVKGTYREGTLKELYDYFTKAWFPQLLKAPGTYASSVISNTGGYLNPLARETTYIGLYKTTNQDSEITYFTDVEKYESTEKYLVDYVSRFEELPVLFFLCNCGMQIWMTIGLFAEGIRRKDRRLIFLLVPSIVGIMVCIAGPTFSHNGIRYALPVICCNFFVSSMMSRETENKQKGRS